MTIQSVTKAWSRDGGSVSTDGRKITVSFREGWQVVSEAADTIDDVIFAAGLPQINSVHPASNWLFVRNVNPSRMGPIYWMVDVEYQGEIGGAGSSSADVSPENEPPLIEWTDTETEEPTDEDDYGFPITNVNGEPVVGITAKLADMVLNVERNYLTWSPYLTRLYRRSVSSDVFQDWPAGTAKLTRFSAKAKTVGNRVAYWRVSASVQFREPYQTVAARAWWKRYRNEGFYERAGALVDFTGGGGSGAFGYAVVNSLGGVDAVALVAGGSGYTSAPTVTFTEEPAGTGFGAAGTAVLTDGVVSSVTVTNPGTAYRSKLVRAVDSNKEPVTTPVLLDARGARLQDSSQCVWIERPVKVTPLPYNALGLV